MPPTSLPDYPDRYALANELHARPFPELSPPCRAAYIAIKQEVNAAERDRDADRAHLVALLDRFGAPHPAPGANHHSTRLGRGRLKWEQHTEFVTYTIFADGLAEKPFDGSVFAMFPEDWLAAAPGKVLTSALVLVELMDSMDAAEQRMAAAFGTWFVPESLAVSRVVDDCALVGSDFRIDENGHVRLAVLSLATTGERRLGRIVQRLLEIETYKSMALLALPQARRVAGQVAKLDRALAEVVSRMADEDRPEDDAGSLDALLRISAETAALSTATAFRFGAAGAYEAIVNDRISVLREERTRSRQTFAEFMTRRFEPAMRTCRSAQRRLTELESRAERASNLLRTRVDVGTSVQNVEVLRRMDERAALQLRLQETVEGLSVVAISYYAVNLGANLLRPLGAAAGVSESWVYALLTPVVVLSVWAAVRRIRRRIASRDPAR